MDWLLVKCWCMRSLSRSCSPSVCVCVCVTSLHADKIKAPETDLLLLTIMWHFILKGLATEM